MTVPISSGTPTSAISKNPIRPTPASSAASETSSDTGDPVRISNAPAWAANATGIRSFDGVSPSRTASTTTMG